MFKARACGILLLVSLASAPRPAFAADPSALYKKALHKSKSPGDQEQAISLLIKANALWEQAGSSDPDYVRSLDLLVLLQRSEAASAAAQSHIAFNSDDSWAQLASLARRAVEIVQSNPNLPLEDQALAFELAADATGRESVKGAPFWDQATAIRKQLVSQINSTLSAESPTSSADAAPPYAIGDGVSTPRPISKVEPEYTDTARRLRYSGTVLLKLVVNAQGLPQNITLLRGLGFGLDEQAARAVSTWRFQPATKDGHPVPVEAHIEVSFRIL